MKYGKSSAFVVVTVALLARTGSLARTSAQPEPLPFSCATFHPDVSATDLSREFGSEHVETAPVPWGGSEGEYNEGTVLFGNDPERRVEIFWRNTAEKRRPQWVSVRGARSRWRTPGGVTIGTSLRKIEQLNARPFRLLGFGTDVSGTVMSWSGGRLDLQDAAGCRVRLRLSVAWDRTEDGRARAFRELLGTRDFSSSHPAMQAFDPAVRELFLSYR